MQRLAHDGFHDGDDAVGATLTRPSGRAVARRDPATGRGGTGQARPLRFVPASVLVESRRGDLNGPFGSHSGDASVRLTPMPKLAIESGVTRVLARDSPESGTVVIHYSVR